MVCGDGQGPSLVRRGRGYRSSKSLPHLHPLPAPFPLSSVPGVLGAAVSEHGDFYGVGWVGVLISLLPTGDHNLGRRKPRHVISWFWGLAVRQQCQQSWFLLRAVRENVPGLSPSFWSFAGLCWLSLAGVVLPDLCHHPHMTFSLWMSRSPNLPFCNDMGRIGVGAHPTPLALHFSSLHL